MTLEKSFIIHNKGLKLIKNNRESIIRGMQSFTVMCIQCSGLGLSTFSKITSQPFSEIDHCRRCRGKGKIIVDWLTYIMGIENECKRLCGKE